MILKRLPLFIVRVLARRACAPLLIGFAFSAHASPDSLVNDPSWTTFQGGASHSGFIDRDLIPHRESTRWTRQVHEGHVDEGTAVADGLVFATATGSIYDGLVVAVNATSGEEVWRVSLDNLMTISAPAYAAGRVYVQTNDNTGNGHLRAFDSATGAAIFSVLVREEYSQYHFAPTPVDGTIYADGGLSGGLYAFDGMSGQQTFFTALPECDNWEPVPYGSDKLVTYTRQIDILDRATGAVLDSIPTPDWYIGGSMAFEAPVIVANRAFYTNGYFLNGADLVAKTTPIHINIGATGPVSSDGDQLFVVVGGALTVRSPADGSQIWAADPFPSSGVEFPIVVFRNHVIVSNESETAIVSRRTHQVEVRIPYGGKLSYANDTLFITARSGVVTAIAEPSTDLFVDDFE